MAIQGNDKNQSRPAAPQSAMQQGFARARDEQQPGDDQFNTGAGFDADQGDDTWNFLNPGSNGLYTVSDVTAGEHLTKLTEKLKEIYKAASPQIQISVIPMSMDTNPQLNIDTLVVVTQLANAPQLGLAYHPILLAGSIPKIEDATVQVSGGMGNTNVVETRVEGDVADEIFYDVVKQEVQKNFPGVQNQFVALAEVLPRTFNFADDNALQKVARNASMAGATTLSKNTNLRPDLNLAKVQKSNKLTLRTNFGQPNDCLLYTSPSPRDS